MVGGERILIVEDEELMRELLTKILAGKIIVLLKPPVLRKP